MEEIRCPKTGKLLHLVIRGEYNLGERSRLDLVSAENFLQLAVMQIPSATSFRPHIHLERSRKLDNLKAQESWVVIYGEVEAIFYSEEGQELERRLLKSGDCSMTLHGGHAYVAHSDSRVLEFKSGPYEGQDLDKKFLD